MKFIKIMEGVKCDGKITNAALCRDYAGRLIIVGDGVDLFDLLAWIDNNPLAQFREISVENETPPLPEIFEPSDTFKHLFSPEGTIL